MWTSSTDKAGKWLPLLPLVVVTLLLDACASHPATENNVKPVVSKYAAMRQGQAAGKSNAAHTPPVPHTAAAAKQAREASGDYVMGLKAMMENDDHKAMIIFQSISSRFPLLSGPLVNEGLIYLKQNNPQDAEQVLKQAIKINEKNPYAWNALGLAERETGHFQNAKNDYTRALELDPLYARAHFNLAVLADLYLDDLPLALTHYKQYQELQQTPDKNVAIWITDLERRIKTEAPQPSAAPSAPTQSTSGTGATAASTSQNEKPDKPDNKK
jgi:Flp pilus assembly protein TadD